MCWHQNIPKQSIQPSEKTIMSSRKPKSTLQKNHKKPRGGREGRRGGWGGSVPPKIRTQGSNRKMGYLEVKRNSGARTHTLLSGTKSPEILSGFRNDRSVKFYDDSTLHLPSNTHIQVASWVNHRWSSSVFPLH